MKLPKSKLLVTGNLQAENITIKIADSTLVVDKKTQQKIEHIWQQKLIESEKRGAEIYNGTSYRLNHWSYTDNHLQLELALLQYKTRLGLAALISKGEIEIQTYPHNGCFVGATVVTVDGDYLMVRLSGTSMNNNAIEMLGGMVETETPFSGSEFLFNVLYQELEEEAGIVKKDISECFLRALFTGGTSHYGFYFEVNTSLSRTELESRFKNNQDTDIDSLIFLDKTSYLTTLNQMSENKKLIASIIK